MPFTQPTNVAPDPLAMARLATAVAALATSAIAAITGACAILGCAPSPSPQAPTTPAAAPVAPPLQPLEDSDWLRFRSKRHRLSIPFPQGKTWQIRDSGTPWLVASHPGSHAVVLARSWIEPRPVSLQQCEALARKTTCELPEQSAASTIEQIDSNTRFSSAFSSRLVVALASDCAHPNTTAGYAFAFGVAGRNCVAIVVKTPAAQKATSTAQNIELAVRIIENTHYVPSIPSSSDRITMNDEQ